MDSAVAALYEGRGFLAAVEGKGAVSGVPLGEPGHRRAIEGLVPRASSLERAVPSPGGALNHGKAANVATYEILEQKGSSVLSFQSNLAWSARRSCGGVLGAARLAGGRLVVDRRREGRMQRCEAPLKGAATTPQTDRFPAGAMALNAGVEGQGLGFAGHFHAEVVAHQVAELFDEGVGDEADRAESLLAGAHHAALAQDGEVFGDVGLAGAGGFGELSDGALALHEEVEEAQAEGLGEGAEAGGDHFQRGVAEGRGSGRGERFHENKFDLLLYENIVMSASKKVCCGVRGTLNFFV